MSNYKHCFVPKCNNTSFSTPTKLFISVPRCVEERKAWLNAVGRNSNEISVNTHLECCEDHFNLPEDMENYLEYKMMGVKKRMKKGVVPHLLNCQSDDSEDVKRPKRTKLHMIEEVLLQPFVPQIKQEMEEDDELLQPSTSQNKLEDLQQFEVKIESGDPLSHSFTNPNKTKSRDVGTNVNLRPQFQSKAVSCEILPATVNAATGEEDENTINDNETEFTNSLALKFTDFCIKKNPKLYLGLSKSWFDNDFITTLSRETKLSEMDIKLTLMKIKLNDSFERLADLFGLSEDLTNEIFYQTVPILCQFFKQLIFWPETDALLKLFQIPLYFNCNCLDESIIDCLEFEISKPFIPIYYTVTWSKTKKCNTMKYLISCTNEGFINFISQGYGGTKPDKEIVEDCAIYLGTFSENFDNTSENNDFLPILKNKNFDLVNASKVSSDRVFKLKSIIEKIFNEIKSFEYIKNRPILYENSFKFIDKIVKIISALINLQCPIEV